MYTIEEVLGWFDGYYENEKVDRSPYSGYEVIAAEYEHGGYEGDVFVLMKSGNQYYEVNGSHCSCYGLENQWDPEVTTEEALRHRVEKGQSYGAFNSCIPEIKSHFGW